MKVDKETLVKHRFWVLLGVLFPLIIAAFIMLWLGASGEITAKESTFNSAMNKVKTVASRELKNDSWINILKDREELAKTKKKQIWIGAWDRQKDYFNTWPTARFEEDPSAKSFGDPINSNDRQFYARLDVYLTQIDPIINVIEPVNILGDKGVVQYKDDPKKMIRFVATWEKMPTIEEIWLAQEDLWVQRGLLEVVKAANDTVANFQEVKEGVPEPNRSKGETARSRFTNPKWQLDLTLAENQQGKPVIRYQLTNISNRRQWLGFQFQVELQGAPVQVILVDGEPLAPNQTSPVQEHPLEVARSPQGVNKVVQLFTWRTAPVKRIDAFEIGTHSHRTLPKGLKASPKFADQSQAKPGIPGAAPAGPQVPAAFPGAGGAAAGGADVDKTPNGLLRRRYVEITEQVRRIPVGLVVVVDQANIQDVLTAVANSALRIQTTQVQWEHYRGPEIRPENLDTGPKRDPKKPKPGAFPMPVQPGFGPGTETPQEAASATESSNLVTLAIYGLASLYERYKEPLPPGVPGTVPGGPGAIAPGGPAPAPGTK